MTDGAKRPPETREIPASPVLAMLLDRLRADYERQVNEAVEAARQEAGHPPGVGFHAGRRVWVLPADGGDADATA